MLKADGFDAAILGRCDDKVTGSERLVYSVEACVNILTERDEMERDEAEEYFWFNVHGAYVGESTPVFVEDYDEDYDYDEEDSESD